MEAIDAVVRACGQLIIGNARAAIHDIWESSTPDGIRT